MDFNKNKAGNLGASPALEPGVKAEEIELYDALIAFADLSPEEQRRLMAHPKSVHEAALESPFAAIVNTPPANESVVAAAMGPEPAFCAAVSPPPAFELVEAEEAPERAAESLSDFEESNEPGETDGRGEELFDRSRTGALLAGLSVVSDGVFSGDLSRAVCLACGSESGADDLFCVGCGVFIDNIGSPATVNPACGECGQGIAADEIFCPWCGAAPTA